jgi:4-alpha-glucanotransferase
MQRIAGILQPVFAMRTEDDLGTGDTDGAGQMIEWCHRHGVRVLQLLPINETGGDHCPYNAISAMAIDPTTIAISPRHIPDLTEADFRQLAPPGLLAELRQGPVNYPRVKALKRALLEAAFAQFASGHPGRATPRMVEFYEFITENLDWILEYALFRVLMEENGDHANWERWPAEHQSPENARAWLGALPEKRRAEFLRRQSFFMYVQWLAFGQWQALKARAEARNAQLMGDMPIGIARGSADVWANRALFDLDWSAGAPPEKFFKADPFTEKWGQNWGAPLYQWDELRRRDFDWWRARLALARRIFHLCRLDHVMGLFRIYAFPWPPERNAQFLPLSQSQAAAKTGGRLPGFRPFPDDTPEHIAANQKRGGEILKVLLDSSGGMTVVAEDLGVVPGYVRTALHQLGVPGFRVPSLFREPDGSFSNPAGYAELSVAQPSTHDHAPLAAAWAEHWNSIDNCENAADHLLELRRVMDFAGLREEPPRDCTARLHEAVLRATLQANSWLAVVMLTDVFAQTARCNTPGAVSSENWSARAPCPVAQMDRDPNLLAKTQTFARLIRETGRG